MSNDIQFRIFKYSIASIALTMCLVFSIPVSALAHAQNGTLTGRYNKSVERWRPAVKKYLKHYHIYSREREGRILNIIKHESGGRPTASNAGQIGLMQFLPHWKHNYSRSYFTRKGIKDYHSDNRKSGDWSIRRICQVYKQGGTSKVKSHWRATYWR